jgi:uncharacterized protein YfeS
MKVMISKPGIPIEKINQDSFYALCNNNNSPIGALSNWNGMMLLGNILYTVSSENTINILSFHYMKSLINTMKN